MRITLLQENNGLDRIEVKDDGCGIKRTDVPYVCLPSYTSKICGYADLGKCNGCEDLLQIHVHPLHNFQNIIDTRSVDSILKYIISTQNKRLPCTSL